MSDVNEKLFTDLKQLYLLTLLHDTEMHISPLNIQCEGKIIFKVLKKLYLGVNKE